MTHLPPHSKEKGLTPEDDQGEGSVTGWQPIETAPKDQSVLLYGKSDDTFTSEVSFPHPVVFSGYWCSLDGAWCTTGSSWVGPFMKPTHWQPLPEPPSSLPSSLPEREQA